MTRVSVCIPAVRATTIEGAIASVASQRHPAWELIVVHQGGDPGVPRAVRLHSALFREIRYLRVEVPGLSRARNAAVAAFEGDILAMMDDDCEAHPDWLAQLTRAFEADPTIGLVGGSLIAPAPPRGAILYNCPHLEPADTVYDPVASGRQAPAGWDWVGGNFAVRRRVLDRIGAFDEYLGAGAEFPGCEDTDFKLRLEAAGVRMRSTPAAEMRHTHGHRTGLRQVLKHQRNYARGNGAMAAKLTLMGDSRGEQWLEQTRAECSVGWRPDRRVADSRRLRIFEDAYAACLRQYDVDERGLLQLRRALEAVAA